MYYNNGPIPAIANIQHISMIRELPVGTLGEDLAGSKDSFRGPPPRHRQISINMHHVFTLSHGPLCPEELDLNGPMRSGSM